MGSSPRPWPGLALLLVLFSHSLPSFGDVGLPPHAPGVASSSPPPPLLAAASPLPGVINTLRDTSLVYRRSPPSSASTTSTASSASSAATTATAATAARPLAVVAPASRRLGGTSPSPNGANAFMRGVERTTEGADDLQLGRAEVQEFLEELGSENFDEAGEVTRGVGDVFGRLDKGNDGLISLKELTRYWNKLQTLVTVEDVADWVTNAVQLRQYEDVFRRNAIRGFDLPLLLEDNGRALVESLGITDKLHRTQIMRSVQLRLLGVGVVPAPPTDIRCELHSNSSGYMRVDWSNANNARLTIPTHKVRILARARGASEWTEVYAALPPTTAFIFPAHPVTAASSPFAVGPAGVAGAAGDRSASTATAAAQQQQQQQQQQQRAGCQFSLEAWNLLGRSAPGPIVECEGPCPASAHSRGAAAARQAGLSHVSSESASTRGSTGSLDTAGT